VPMVIDSTVLSNFALVGAVDLLATACSGGGITTSFVITELQNGQRLGKLPPLDMSWLQVVALTTEENECSQRLRGRLGAGEASCLAVAMQRRLPLLTDDLVARKIAMREGVCLSGTIGVLVGLVDSAVIPLHVANELLGKMIRVGYFASFRKIDHLVGLE